jgi:hypothetical protein
MTAARAAERCGACAHFRNDAAFLEAALPGLASLSSGHASVRGEDGLCLRHDRYLTATSWCSDFIAAKDKDSPVRP